MSVRNRQRGRPCDLTPQKEKVLLGAIQRGLPYKQASALAGISYMTFNRWREKGSEPDAPCEFSDFCDRLAAAEAKAADALCRVISKAGRTRDWRAAAWMLERRCPDEWGRRESLPPPPEPPPEMKPRTAQEEEEMLASIMAVLERKGVLAKHGYFKAPVAPQKEGANVATVSKLEPHEA